ncbi:MAG: two-component regulator propeller domain-containing protein [Ferruginibacter sp.]
MNNLRVLLSLFFLACCAFVYPQNHHVHFDHIGFDQGLSHSNVLSIMQDKSGFMWFGTRDGLNKYDGYSFTFYKNDPHNKNSIGSNFIMKVIESNTGELWIATVGGGVSRYDRNKESFTNYTHDPKNANSISHDVVHGLLEDEYGKIWIGTEAGLDMLDPVTNKMEHFTHNLADNKSISDSYIRYIFEDMSHNIWMATLNGGINLLNRKNKNFTRFQHDKKNRHSIGSNNVYTMFEDSKRRLWVGTDGAGMDLFNMETGAFTHFKHDENNANSVAANTVYAITEDAENNLWIGTENGGLSIFNYDAGSFTTYKHDEIDGESISSNSIYSVYKDLKSNMWLGTFTGGIDMANRDKARFAHYKHMLSPNSLSNNQVLSIFEDSKQNIWLGTDGGGLNVFNPTTGNFTHFRHEKNNKKSICGDYVLAVHEDSKGNIWAGTWGDGMTVFNPTSKTFRHFKNEPGNPSSLNSNNVWKIFEDRDKNIWVCTFGGGLDLLNADQKSFTHHQYAINRTNGISGIYVVSIFEDSDGQLWVCTDGDGLNLYDKKTKSFSRFLHDETKNSISNNSLSSIFEDGDKNLWIGTRVGLNFFNKKTGRFTVYTMADGLPDNVIFGILEDSKKNLWISTNKGISRFNPITKVFKNFSVSDGLQSNEFKMHAFCKSRSGVMYFGGTNGFNQFFPDSVKAVAFEPPLVITKFNAFNKKVLVPINHSDSSPLRKNIAEVKTITLPYSNTFFSFEFATLNYTTPEKKKYAYILEGFDKEWHEAGTSRIATYTNIDPGKYIFKVRGLNNEGNWSKNIISIQLIIEPPFWLTWWFRLLMVIAIISGMVAFYGYRVNAIKAQRRKLQEKVQEQTLQLSLSTQEEQKARLEADHARIEAELANKELKIKNKELEQFAYVASHDLQEPLRTTAGIVELLQLQYHGKIDEKADKYMAFILEATTRMKVVIKDLLDYSRIGTNMELKKIDCNILVQEMLADIMAAIKEANADIQVAELPVIDGYPTEIKLLFQNLVINAIKFRKKDVIPGIKIDVQQAAHYWEFTISDNGIGIDEKYSQRIFDIFQRLHTNKEYAGSGIGLSHCKKIVELHKGKIWVESAPGEGCIFHFTIHKNNN